MMKVAYVAAKSDKFVFLGGGTQVPAPFFLRDKPENASPSSLRDTFRVLAAQSEKTGLPVIWSPSNIFLYEPGMNSFLEQGYAQEDKPVTALTSRFSAFELERYRAGGVSQDIGDRRVSDPHQGINPNHPYMFQGPLMFKPGVWNINLNPDTAGPKMTLTDIVFNQAGDDDMRDPMIQALRLLAAKGLLGNAIVPNTQVARIRNPLDLLGFAGSCMAGINKELGPQMVSADPTLWMNDNCGRMHVRAESERMAEDMLEGRMDPGVLGLGLDVPQDMPALTLAMKALMDPARATALQKLVGAGKTPSPDDVLNREEQAVLLRNNPVIILGRDQAMENARMFMDNLGFRNIFAAQITPFELAKYNLPALANDYRFSPDAKPNEYWLLESEKLFDDLYVQLVNSPLWWQSRRVTPIVLLALGTDKTYQQEISEAAQSAIHQCFVSPGAPIFTTDFNDSGYMTRIATLTGSSIVEMGLAKDARTPEIAMPIEIVGLLSRSIKKPFWSLQR